MTKENTIESTVCDASHEKSGPDLSALFSLADATSQYGSLERHLTKESNDRIKRAIPTIDIKFREKDGEQSLNLERLHFSYGL